ncbi:hypothetical protein FB451DRAFT_1491400 [Mycena latifolia]|nr:hypothetical protein FB451DRAFT_1491400 [Mycena latifolia]
MSTFNEQEDSPQDFSPLRMKQRRAAIACTTCRRRKVRCLTTEWFPTQPCERCRRKRLTCEYLRVAEEEQHSNSASPSSDIFLSDLPEVGGMPMPSTPPIPAPSSSRELGSAPPLPYTDPPPLSRPLRGVPYYDPVLPAAHRPSMQPAYLNPYFTGRSAGVVDPGYSAPSSHSRYPSPSLPAPNQIYTGPPPASRSNRPFPAPMPNQQVTQEPDLRGVPPDYTSYMQWFDDTR